jgi:CRP-like cAMP-binding protein
MSALVSMEDRKKLLSDVWLFHGATDEELTMLAERAYEVSVGPQVDIVTQHEFGDEFFLVVDGHAAVSRDGVDLGVVNAGDFFGEMALLGTGVRTSSVRSIVAVNLLALRAEHLDEVLASDPIVARRVLNVVVMRLEATNRRLSELEGRRPSG